MNAYTGKPRGTELGGLDANLTARRIIATAKAWAIRDALAVVLPAREDVRQRAPVGGDYGNGYEDRCGAGELDFQLQAHAVTAAPAVIAIRRRLRMRGALLTPCLRELGVHPQVSPFLGRGNPG